LKSALAESPAKQSSKTPKHEPAVVEDQFGHSESSEGIVNHEIFTAQHYRKISDVLLKDENP
jgi:hypothetical protein